MVIIDRFNYPVSYQKDSLCALNIALKTVPLYRGWRKFDQGPETSPDLRYEAMPILTKKDMRRHFPHGQVPDHLKLEDGLENDEIEYTFTSGTTDEKVINIWNQKWWNDGEAASWKLNSHTASLNYPQNDAKLTSSLNIGIHCEEDLPMGHRILGNHLYLNEKINVISWQKRHLERMAQELMLFQPVILEANPSLLARLAFWALDEGIELFSPKVIIFTYEFPSQIHVSAIKRAFASPTISSYGSTETGFVLMQCEDGLFHQNIEYCRIDFQPLSARHGGPELGRILVTTFKNSWSSIVKFDIGDLIRLHSTGECTCGRSEGFIADAIEGRIAYATFTTGGNLITTMAVDNNMVLMPEIRDYSLVQHDMKKYELRVVLSENSEKVQDKIHETLKSIYGNDGIYKIITVPDIMPGPSGKYRRTYAKFDFDQDGLFE